jgi:hypothetical protein
VFFLNGFCLLGERNGVDGTIYSTTVAIRTSPADRRSSFDLCLFSLCVVIIWGQNEENWENEVIWGGHHEVI